MTIKLEPKNVNIKLDVKDFEVSGIVKSQSISVNNNDKSVEFDDSEISVTPIIFNQLNIGKDLIWSVVTTNNKIQKNNGYIATNELTLISLTLPLASSGDKISIMNMGHGGIRVSGDVIFGDKSTSQNGYLESLNYGDFINLQYLNNVWVVINSIGNWQI